MKSKIRNNKRMSQVTLLPVLQMINTQLQLYRCNSEQFVINRTFYRYPLRNFQFNPLKNRWYLTRKLSFFPPLLMCSKSVCLISQKYRSMTFGRIAAEYRSLESPLFLPLLAFIPPPLPSQTLRSKMACWQLTEGCKINRKKKYSIFSVKYEINFQRGSYFHSLGNLIDLGVKMLL